MRYVTLALLLFVAHAITHSKPNPCLKCRKTYTECLKPSQSEDDITACENAYADCFNDNKCYASHQ